MLHLFMIHLDNYRGGTGQVFLGPVQTWITETRAKPRLIHRAFVLLIYVVNLFLFTSHPHFTFYSLSLAICLTTLEFLYRRKIKILKRLSGQPGLKP